MKNLIITTIFICSSILFFSELKAQNDNHSCQSIESKQFDFWIGDWDLTWNDSVKGNNTITKEYQSCVIHENFISNSDQFYGQSFTVYNTKEKIWEQTWIDNQNSYLLFNGGLINNEMILNLVSKDSTKITRMRFTKITPLNFDWFWESSDDNGKNWKTLWLIHYKRKN